MRRFLLVGMTALLALAGAGCLISGTKVFSWAFLPFAFSLGERLSSESVDLTEDSTYEEYGEDIKLIDRLGLTATVENTGSTQVEMSLWVGPNGLTTPNQVEQQGSRILTDITVPGGGSRSIDYKESLQLLVGLDALKEAILSGVFTVYVLSDGAGTFTVPDLVLIVTFTVGL